MLWQDRQETPAKVAAWKSVSKTRSGVVLMEAVEPGGSWAVKEDKPVEHVAGRGGGESGGCKTGNSTCASSTASAEEEVMNPVVREERSASASCGVNSSWQRGAVIARARTAAGCPSASAGEAVAVPMLR